MRADNSRFIRQAAQRRHELTRSKAISALRRLHDQGKPVTFESVAAEARISRSWLYTQPDLRDEIIKLRAEHRSVPSERTAHRIRDRASIDSLQARLAVAHNRISMLTSENERLRHQLALALGQARQSKTGPGGS